MNKHAWWAWAVKNSVCMACWTALAIFFGKWWIALFVVLTISSLETKSERKNGDAGKKGPIGFCPNCGKSWGIKWDVKSDLCECRICGWKDGGG